MIIPYNGAIRKEGGYPERDGGGGEEEGQVWGNSMSLDYVANTQ